MHPLKQVQSQMILNKMWTVKNVLIFYNLEINTL